MKKNNKNIFDHIFITFKEKPKTYIIDCYLDNITVIAHID